jgi:pimeloyl-ACP methyl ester carboxylesterase
MYCLGRGSPTVVFDAGHQDWAPAWAVVQPEVAKWTRACSYDRPGSGFSDTGPMPRTSVRIADELRSALHNAGIAGPYILVGHAFGAVNMRAFAYRYMPDVAGLVLLDTDAGDMASPEMLTREHAVFTLQESELRACRDALAAGRPLSSTPPSVLQPGTICEQRFFRGFPDKAWSAELNASLLHAAQTRLALFDEVVSELHEMPGDETYLREHQISFGSRPIRVLTAASQYADNESTPTDVHLRHLKNAEQRAEAQARFLTLSSNSKQIFAYHSASAYIQFDQPELVVAAIREVYDESRQGDAR